MKISLICRVACLAALALFLSAALAQTTALQPVRLAPGEMVWVAAPNGSFRADLAGSDQQPGMYAYRVKFPAGFRIQPHFHPDNRIVTILAGTLHLGFGEQFDEGNMQALATGSLWTEPAGQPHYVWAKDGEVIIQVIGGNGPSAVIPVQ